MLCEVPLTREQQDFAAEHHGLVYKFLSDNHLPEDEFYDVIIFPYLKAVQDYCSVPSVKEYSFSTIAIRQMRFRLYDYFRKQACRKRNTEILSIHLGLYQDGVPLEETLPANDTLMQEFEMRQILHELAGRVSRQQINIVRMKEYGYGVREIARHEKLSIARIKELLEETRKVLLAVCYE